jgi:HSP20 family protein
MKNMYMTAYEPWRRMEQLRREMDQLFNPPVTQSDNDSAIATCAWVPAVDIKEDPQQFLIEADIPGVDPKDIEISMENGVLTIRGERNSEKREEGKDYKRVERTYGSFYRRFSLPDTADPEKVSASGKNGVLQISIPKRELAQPRKITVQT